MADHLEIRLLREGDSETISQAFKDIGWGKPKSKYQQYLIEQAAGTRICFVAAVESQFAGYVTVNWAPSYPVFVEHNIPEIQDLNVLPQFRKQGIGTRLLDRAEEEVARRSAIVGIGFGLHPGYGSAQRLYVKRGYIPDGRGVWDQDHVVEEGVEAVFNDDLVLHLTKQLRVASSSTNVEE
jgi:GNAT superfamily N-acetyltransferase